MILRSNCCPQHAKITRIQQWLLDSISRRQCLFEMTSCWAENSVPRTDMASINVFMLLGWALVWSKYKSGLQSIVTFPTPDQQQNQLAYAQLATSMCCLQVQYVDRELEHNYAVFKIPSSSSAFWSWSWCTSSSSVSNCLCFTRAFQCRQVERLVNQSAMWSVPSTQGRG